MQSLIWVFLLLLIGANVNAQDQDAVCGQNERFDICGSPCIETCADKPEICIAMCATGCFCKEGYVRESSSNGSSCIKHDECNKQPPVPQCGENEEFIACGSACPLTCDEWSYPLKTSPEVCVAICVPGCFCKAGFYRSKDGRCVKAKECCSENEVYTDCGSVCVETCTYKPKFCTEQCALGCFCRRGYVRASNSTNSPCVSVGECTAH